MKRNIPNYFLVLQQLLKSCLSAKYAVAISMFIAITVKIISQVYFFEVMDDKSFQLLAAKNLLEGHGLTINQVFPGNLSVIDYKLLFGWPPGYSFFIAPLIALFQNNYLAAALCFDILCVLPFFLYLYRLLFITGIETWLRNLFIIGAGFFFYPFASHNCTDFPAVICLLAAFYHTINYAVTNKSLYYTIYIVVFLFLASLFRYLYLPVMFAVPVSLLMAGVTNQKKHWIRSSIFLFTILCLLAAVLLLFQRLQTGSAEYFPPMEKGLYIKHFTKICPFITGSFFDMQIATTFLSNITGVSYVLLTQVIELVGTALLLFLFTVSVRWVVQTKLVLNNSSSIFTFLGIGISAAIILLLLYLSVRNNSIKSLGQKTGWTFVQEFRYYAFCVVFIQLLTFMHVFNGYNSLTKFWKLIAITIGIMLSFQFLHRVYFITKELIHKHDKFYFYEDKRKQTDFILSLPRQLQQQFPQHDIIVTSPNATFCNLAALSNVKAIYNADIINNIQAIQHTKPLKIIAVLSKQVAPYFSNFLQNPHTKLLRIIGDQYFYTIDVSQQ